MRKVEFTVPEDVINASNTLNDLGFKSYLVGGCVRDSLLGRPVQDWDIATDARPEEVMKAFPKVFPTGIQHGTVLVLTPQGTSIEVTTFRVEGPYQDGRHPSSVRFTHDLHEDLARRDFRMNAMAWNPREGLLEDPFAGERDLRDRHIETVGQALDRFQEDGLRPMRALRFAAQLGFRVSEEILQAIPASLDVTRRVAMERIRDELVKILGAPKPSLAFELMRQTRLLAWVLPELLEGVDCEQNEYHAYDVYHHSLRACDESAGDPRLRLAVLLHDIGKPRARRFLRGQNRFYGHDRIGAKMTRQIMMRLRFSNQDIQFVENLVAHHMFYYREEWNDGTVRRFMKRVGLQNLEPLFALRIADEIASGVNLPDYERLEALRSRIAQEKEREVALTVRQLAIDGRDVMETLQLKPGPAVGKILQDLLEKVLEDPALNEREKLLALVKATPPS